MGTFRRGRTAGISRPDRGTVIAGVCAGIARRRDGSVTLVRALFVLAGLVAGLGVAVYLACWLILPAAHEVDATAAGADSDPAGGAGDGAGRAGLVVLARASAGLLGVGLIALLSALVTAFGYGWIVPVAVGALIALCLVSPWRCPAATVLCAGLALALPSIAVSAASISLAPQTGDRVIAPAALGREPTTLSSGLGTLLVDLRRTRLPAAGTVALTIHAGIRRTLVALPADRCVHVRVDYTVHPLAAQITALLSGRRSTPAEGLLLFNRVYPVGIGPVPKAAGGELTSPVALRPGGAVEVGPTGGAAPGPTLVLDVVSQGGGLDVRDYPDSVNPTTHPFWPGFLPPVDPRPMRFGSSRAQYRHELAYWRRRVQQERTWRTQLDRLLPGPCGA